MKICGILDRTGGRTDGLNPNKKEVGQKGEMERGMKIGRQAPFNDAVSEEEKNQPLPK